MVSGIDRRSLAEKPAENIPKVFKLAVNWSGQDENHGRLVDDRRTSRASGACAEGTDTVLPGRLETPLKSVRSPGHGNAGGNGDHRHGRKRFKRNAGLKASTFLRGYPQKRPATWSADPRTDRPATVDRSRSENSLDPGAAGTAARTKRAEIPLEMTCRGGRGNGRRTGDRGVTPPWSLKYRRLDAIGKYHFPLIGD